MQKKTTTVTLKKIRFESFVKLFFYCSIGAGFLFGLLALMLSLFSVPITVTLGVKTFDGWIAGMLTFLIAPFLFALIGGIFGAFSYLPSMFVYRVMKGVTLKGEFDVIEEKE